MCVDCRKLAVLNNLLKIGTTSLSRADQLNLTCTDIVDLAAISQYLQRLAKLTRMDLCSRSVGNVKTFAFIFWLSDEPKLPAGKHNQRS